MAVKYPPYVDYSAGISKVFEEIKKASVPEKFTNDFLKTVLGLKSSSYVAIIPFLKRLGFLDSANVPTQAYKDFRDNSKSGIIMASRIKEAFPEIFQANEYAYKLNKNDLSSKLITRLGVSADDKIVPKVVNGFVELTKMSNFEIKELPKPPKVEDEANEEREEGNSINLKTKLGISYTINLNLPATDNVDVFNAIFKSLKEHILSAK